MIENGPRTDIKNTWVTPIVCVVFCSRGRDGVISMYSVTYPIPTLYFVVKSECNNFLFKLMGGIENRSWDKEFQIVIKFLLVLISNCYQFQFGFEMT